MLINMKEIERIGGVKGGHNPDITHALHILELNELLLPVPPRHTVEPSGLGSWLVMDTQPKPIQRSNWVSEADARAEAARLDANPNSPST